MIATKMISDIKKILLLISFSRLVMPEMSCAFVVKTDSGTEV
jgi:hypothetical protein